MRRRAAQPCRVEMAEAALPRFGAGGEEFTVILPETEVEGALKVAERIRAGVAGADLVGCPGEPAVHRTVSVGVATFPDASTSAAGLVEAADRAMYLAKRLGRDRVVAAEALDG